MSDDPRTCASVRHRICPKCNILHAMVRSYPDGWACYLCDDEDEERGTGRLT